MVKELADLKRDARKRRRNVREEREEKNNDEMRSKS
jgi:hypothetical protein